MDEHEKYAYWLNYAQEDMRAAEAMLNAHMWVYTVFMCQQAIEKIAKGLYGFFVDADNIPYTHNIAKLVKKVEDKLREPVKNGYYDLFETLSGYYLNNRYPDFKNTLSAKTNENTARELYARSKEAFAWLQTLKP